MADTERLCVSYPSMEMEATVQLHSQGIVGGLLALQNERAMSVGWTAVQKVIHELVKGLALLGSCPASHPKYDICPPMTGWSL